MRRDVVNTPEPTTATRTVRELIQALTQLAGELPRGLDTPVEVGLIVDHGTFDASAAFSVEPVTATWPGFRPGGAECRHTTVSLIGDPNHPDADRYTRHEPGPTGHPDWEDPAERRLCAHADQGGASMHWLEPGEQCDRSSAYQGQPDFTRRVEQTERPAEPGELCTCGRPAIVAYLGGAFGPTGHCGIQDGGDRTGPCPFCGGPRHSQLAGRCPQYRLRLQPERGE
jgi:hypothetical protein